MSVLFAISVFCMCAVLWAALSVSRHVLATQYRRQAARHPKAKEDFAEIFFEDKMQQIREHTIKNRESAAAAMLSSWMSNPMMSARMMSSPLRIEPSVQPVYPAPAVAHASVVRPAFELAAIEQPVIKQEPVTEPAAFIPPPVASVLPVEPVFTQPVDLETPLLRKPPQSVPANGLYRADWDYFNKDMGDLTDPYESALRDRLESKNGTGRY